MDKCFKCGSENVAPRHDEIFECADCCARMSHGEQMPRITVQPNENEHGGLDWRFVVMTFEYADGREHQHIIDRRLAKLLAANLESVSHGGHVVPA